tara:strand:+ start:1276 stop:1428 length:153 start_codon:yes stop_codon:yes gene_type:complete
MPFEVFLGGKDPEVRGSRSVRPEKGKKFLAQRHYQKREKPLIMPKSFLAL